MASTERVPDYDITRAAGCPLDPAPALRQVPGPLSRVRLWDGSTAWLVTGHAEHRALLADPRVSVDRTRPGMPRVTEGADGAMTDAEARRMAELAKQRSVPGLSFILKDDPEHARLRRMVTGAFSIRRVEAMRPAVRTIVDRFLDELTAGPRPVDLVEAFALPVPSLVICELLGVPYTDHGFFQENSTTIISRSSTALQRFEAMGNLGEYLDEMVGRRLVEPGGDLLSTVAERVRTGELPRQEAVGMAVLMLFAGHETTANMIALGTLALLEHPDQLAVLRDTDDPRLVASAVEELLRYLTITHGGLMRVAVADLELAGQLIRAGEGIIVVSETANRDPAVFPDPDRLDLRRDARQQVGFGYGPHACVGQPLARMELQVAYPALLRRVPTLRLATTLDQIPFKQDGFVYGVHHLPVTW
ncbi:cytochrome P450 [Actinophytocola xanthii]|uniref:Cytochrome n=1 Tax=Actinophytocola xanthii TaxID=1912961 RepID=A0A1Q8CVW2_9PSEU|nr:cytochrome P450 [Actinophytocola xanthii]OLF18489.1 cytochrome [Actinophytocola xanthii]